MPIYNDCLLNKHCFLLKMFVRLQYPNFYIKMEFKTALAQFLGLKIREARQKANINQEYLADKIGLTRTSISNIESGRQLAPLDALYKISHVLGTELHFLLPTYTEVNTLTKAKESNFDKLKTNQVPKSSIDIVKDILDKYKK